MTLSLDLLKSNPSRFQSRVHQAVWLPIIMALVLAALFFLQIKNLLWTNLEVSHSDLIISDITLMEKLMTDAESGMRGYILSRSKGSLESYYKARREVPVLYDSLFARQSRVPEQLETLKKIKKSADEWIVYSEWPLRLVSVGKNPNAGVSRGVGRKVRDRLIGEFEEFVTAEKQIRDRKVQDAKQAAKTTQGFGFGLVIVLGFVLAFRSRKIILSLSQDYESAIGDLEAKAVELSESREWFSKTLLSIGDGVVVVDPAETVEFLNPIAEKLTGWTLLEAKGRKMQEVFAVIYEKTREPAHNLVKLALAQEEASPLLSPESMLLISKDGQEHPIEESAAPIMGKGGELLGVILVFRDISERKKSASLVAETERRFQTVANAAPVLIWTADTQKQYDWFNEGWLSFTGRTLEDQIGTGWIDEVHPEDVANRMSIYFSAFDARKPFEMQYRLRRHDGEYRIVLDRGSPRFSPDGDFVGYIGSCSDITQAEVARKKLEDLAVDLEKALRSRDEFLSIASHELKTPLTSLRLQLQITQRKINVAENLAPSPQKLKQVVDLCLDQSSRITNLIEELLDVSRIQEGKLSFNFEEVDLVKLVRDQVEQLSEQFRQAGCEVSLEATPVTVVCDRFRMDQVVTNLLTNAIKYGAQSPVKISVSRHNGEAWLQVEDHGVGIPKEHQQSIFNRFERVEESRNISGLGLGLYIAKQIVTAHKGSIDVESEQGRGSIFTVKLKVHATLRSFTMRDEELSS